MTNRTQTLEAHTTSTLEKTPTTYKAGKRKKKN